MGIESKSMVELTERIKLLRARTRLAEARLDQTTSGRGGEMPDTCFTELRITGVNGSLVSHVLHIDAEGDDLAIFMPNHDACCVNLVLSIDEVGRIHINIECEKLDTDGVTVLARENLLNGIIHPRAEFEVDRSPSALSVPSVVGSSAGGVG